jgi:hypothetical protein
LRNNGQANATRPLAYLWQTFEGEIAEPHSAIVTVRAFVGEIAEPRSVIVSVRAFVGGIAEPHSVIVSVRCFVGEIAEPRSAIVPVRTKRLPIRYLGDSLFHIQPGFKDLAISNTFNVLI